MTYLAIDVSATAVTAAVWSPSGLVSTASVPVATSAPREWWDAVEGAVGSLSADLVEVEGMGLSSPWLPVPVTSEGEPVAGDDPRVEWVVSARDFVASLLTGRLATDPTMASASGAFLADGTYVGTSGVAPQRGSTEVLGDLLLPAARRLGLRSRIPVVTGATSLVCAAEGAGPAPVVVFGSPLVVAVPVSPPAADPPEGVRLLAGGRSYQVYEAFVRSAGEVRDVLDALAPEATFVYAAGVGDRATRRELTAATGLPLVHRRSPEVGTLGLAMLVATGAGGHLDRESANPVAYADEPEVLRA